MREDNQRTEERRSRGGRVVGVKQSEGLPEEDKNIGGLRPRQRGPQTSARVFMASAVEKKFNKQTGRTIAGRFVVRDADDDDGFMRSPGLHVEPRRRGNSRMGSEVMQFQAVRIAFLLSLSLPTRAFRRARILRETHNP